MNDDTKAKLRSMTWRLTRSKPTRYQRNVARVMNALRDETIAARLAELAETEHDRGVRARDLNARKYWLGRFTDWDGETDIAEEFAQSMADALEAFAKRPPEYVLDLSGAVAEALDACELGRAYAKNPGRARLSAALRALGFKGKAVDRMLDFDRKA